MPVNPFSARPWRRAGGVVDRRAVVEIPDDSPTTAAFFLLMRRIRTPLLVLIAVIVVSVIGLSLIPGRDEDGNVTRLSVFDAFYFMSYTASTIGFGEIVPFTTAQRMWVTGSIYASVFGWGYTLASLVGALQEPSFREALAVQRFRRQVRHIREPFVLIAGFGNAGRLVSRGLDGFGRRFVVVDPDRARIEVLEADQLVTDPPALAGDLHTPGLLGMAGLGSPHLEAVVALTDDDETNLAVLMAAHLLRPDVPAIIRAGSRAAEELMHDFGPDTVINPFDRFGAYLVLALDRPVTHQVVTWLLAAPGSPLPTRRQGLADGTWVVVGDDAFADEIRADLTTAGITVESHDLAHGAPDVADVVGFVAGTPQDTRNLSLASRARLDNQDLFIVVRQRAHTNAPLLEALDFDAVFSPTDLVAQEVLARVVTPLFWRFLDFLVHQDDEWSTRFLARLVEYCGERLPHLHRVQVDDAEAPGVLRWLGRGHTFTVGDLLSSPEDREVPLAVVALMLVRDGDAQMLPAPRTEIQAGDILLLAARRTGVDEVTRILQYEEMAEYAATGRRVPFTWVWRTMTGYRATRATRHTG